MRRDVELSSSAVRPSAVAAILLTLSAAIGFGVQAGPAGPYGFSGNSGNDTLTVFDLSTGAAVGPDIDLLPEGDYPYDTTLHPDGSEVWICGAVGDGVIVLDAVTHAILDRIDLAGTAEYPVDVAFNGDGSVAYVASRDSDVVAVIDTATYMVTGTIPIATSFLGPGKMAFSTLRNELYVVEWFDNELYVVDAATEMVTPVDVGDSLWDLTLDPSQDTLYIADRGTDQVHVFDLDSLMVTTSVSVGDDPWGIDITPNGNLLAVANEDSSEVSIIDVATMGVTPIILPAGSDPRDVVVADSGLVAYVPSGDVTGDDAIYVIDLATAMIADTIGLGSVNPNSMAVDPSGFTGTIFSSGFEAGDTSAW